MARFTVLALFGLVLTGTQALAIEWNVKRFDGRDYIPIDQLAEFYELPRDVPQQDKTLYLSRDKRELRITENSREIELNGIKYWLAFPVLKREDKLWMSRIDLGKTIEPGFRPESISELTAFTTVVLDPGHGGHDKGAASLYEYEKNFALDVARRVRNELQKSGVRVIMTRNSDAFIELQARPAVANAKTGTIFVSLHFNSSPNIAATGLEVFCITPRGSPSTEHQQLSARDMVQEPGNANELSSFSLASAVQHALQGSSLSMFDRGVKRSRFAVLRLSKVPAILIEGGFLSNSNDSRLVASTAWRDRYAKAVATGILQFKRLAESKAPPRTVAEYRNPASPAVAPVPSPSPSPATPAVNLRDLPKNE